MGFFSKIDIQGIEWIDQIFEGRNKAYGAYVLRKNEVKNVITGVVAAIFALVLVLLVPRALAVISGNNGKELVIIDRVSLSKPPITDPELKPIKVKIEVPKLPHAATVKFTAPKVEPDELVRPADLAPAVNEIAHSQIGSVSTPGTSEGVDLPQENPSLGKQAGEKDNQPFFTVEEMPVYPGGDAGLLGELGRYLGKHYPSAAIQNGLEGRVTVKFVVERDGSVSNVEVISGQDLGGGLPEVAIQAVKLLKHFKPGKQNGIPVRVYYNVPLTFQLQSGN